MNPRARTPIALAAALAASGCFQYVPVSTEAVPSDQDVRVYVSRRGMAELPEDLPTGGSFVTGRWARTAGDSVLIQIPVVRRLDDPNAPDIRQNVFLPRVEVEEVRLRRFSPSRTALAVGGAAGVGAAILLGVMKAGGNDPPGPDEGPDQIRIPFLSIPTP